jgi:DNA polymerase-3 subunit beta
MVAPGDWIQFRIGSQRSGHLAIVGLDAAGAVTAYAPASGPALRIAAGRDQALPLLTAIRLADAGEQLALGCTDRYRMAVRRIPWRRIAPAPVPVALVPARAFADAAKALGSGRSRVAAELHLGLDDSTLGIECGGRRLISRLVDVQAPDYDARVPHAGPWRAEVDTATLIEAVKRVSLVAAPLTPLRLAFTAGEVRLEAATGDEAKAAATLSATLHGAELTVAVKPQFLLDGLAALDSDLATITFTDARQPVLLTGKPDGEPESEFRYLTMPLRL